VVFAVWCRARLIGIRYLLPEGWIMDAVGGQAVQKQKTNYQKQIIKIMLLVVPADAYLQPQQFYLTCHLFKDDPPHL
jgi:hypothetical protein